MRKKLIKVTGSLFGYGMAILIVVCFLVALAYVVAFLVGMPVSGLITDVCTKNILPVVYKSGILLCLIGLINMYLRGVLLFRLEVKCKNKNDV